MGKTSTKAIAAVILPVCCIAVATVHASAEDDQHIREAAGRAVRLIDRTSAKFLETRKCFACHTQTLSAMVLKDAQKRGFQIDQENLKRQVDRVSELHRFTKRREPADIRVDTVGYGLWGLDIGQHVPDAMTEDMTWYLLNYQKDAGHWSTTVHRPPTEASDFTTNFVAIRGLTRYGTAKQKNGIATRTAAVKRWLATAVATDTEDQVFRLRLAHELGFAPEQKEPLVQRLLQEQHSSGGWAQTPSMKPDAYATGSVLVALHDAGGTPTADRAWQSGLNHLMQTQMPDGSWLVRTRAKPLQEYFESGFPHGKDQFISAFATGWATKALLLALEEEKTDDPVCRP